MRDDEIRARLVETNPWWRARLGDVSPTAWAADDRGLRDRARHDLGYRATILDDVATGPLTDALVLLHGPRRVGKSVVLKDVVLALCGRPDVDPQQVLYLPADGLTARDLTRVLVLGRDLTRAVDRAEARPRVWLFDEITSIDGWTSVLKFARDNTALGDDTVVCTGSSWSAKGDVERDLLAGRAGSSVRRTRVLHPMRFREYLAATRPEIPRPDRQPAWALQDEPARQAALDAELFVADLDLAWQAYLTSGGFPRAVAEHTRLGGVNEAFLRDLLAWLRQDVEPEAPPESIPRLLSELHARSGAPLNRSKTAEVLGYPGRQAFERRVDRLVRSFGGLWCPQRDESGRAVVGAQSKFYLADPLLAWLGHELHAGTAVPDLSRLTEAALGIHLAARVDDEQPGRWVSADTIGYLRTGGGGEVDFGPIRVPTASGAEGTTPLEAKWVSAGWRGEARTLEARFGRGILATKTVTDLTRPIWAVPAPVVALFLH